MFGLGGAERDAGSESGGRVADSVGDGRGSRVSGSGSDSKSEYDVTGAFERVEVSGIKDGRRVQRRTHGSGGGALELKREGALEGWGMHGRFGG